jgi:hypothetical protein
MRLNDVDGAIPPHCEYNKTHRYHSIDLFYNYSNTSRVVYANLSQIAFSNPISHPMFYPFNLQQVQLALLS